MRLLNTSTFKLETFIGGRVPPYAILSHTWGEDEVLFEDIQRAPKKQWKTKTGAKKVLKAVQQAAKGGFGYIWIDNCCIDKSSSAELSEAINSMFRWYEQSKVCYVYLSDVPPSASKSRRKRRGHRRRESRGIVINRRGSKNWHYASLWRNSKVWRSSKFWRKRGHQPGWPSSDTYRREMEGWKMYLERNKYVSELDYNRLTAKRPRPGRTAKPKRAARSRSVIHTTKAVKVRTQTWKSILPFMRSRWFKRGWTLQELIAPQKVVFFGMTWQTLGTRTSMAEWIHAVTRIDLDILYDSGSKSLTDQACRGCSQWPCPKHKWFTVPSKSVRLKSYSVHTKMVWARNRKTTRPEDRAYSLMGIFGINMPLLYGEEGAHAFLRLQEEIIKTTRDQSILLYYGNSEGCFASSPDCFYGHHRFEKTSRESEFQLEKSTNFLSVSLLIYSIRSSLVMAIVESCFGDDPSKRSRPIIYLTYDGSKYIRGPYVRDISRITYEGRGRWASGFTGELRKQKYWERRVIRLDGNQQGPAWQSPSTAPMAIDTTPLQFWPEEKNTYKEQAFIHQKLTAIKHLLNLHETQQLDYNFLTSFPKAQGPWVLTRSLPVNYRCGCHLLACVVLGSLKGANALPPLAVFILEMNRDAPNEEKYFLHIEELQNWLGSVEVPELHLKTRKTLMKALSKIPLFRDLADEQDIQHQINYEFGYGPKRAIKYKARAAAHPGRKDWENGSAVVDTTDVYRGLHQKRKDYAITSGAIIVTSSGLRLTARLETRELNHLGETIHGINIFATPLGDRMRYKWEKRQGVFRLFPSHYKHFGSDWGQAFMRDTIPERDTEETFSDISDSTW